MNRNLAVVAWLAVGLSVGCGDDGASGPDAGPGERRLVLFHTNDEHSHLFGHSPEIDDFPAPTTAGDGTIVGGLARRGTVLDNERAAATALGIDTLTVSAGDETQGTLSQIGFQTTSPDFTLMKRIGYDVMTPGNHEFDLGPAAYANAIAGALANGGLPQIVATNIKFDSSDAGDDTLAAHFAEGTTAAPIKRYHVITTPAGIKVGFFGVQGIQASFYAPQKAPVLFSSAAAAEGNLTAGLPRLYADIEPTITALREVEGVDVVVMLSHSGVDTDNPSAGEDYKIAENVAGIDVIISGHSHTPLTAPQMVMGPDAHLVPIVQAGSYGEWLGRLEIVIPETGRPTVELDASKTKLIAIDDTIVAADATLVADLEALIIDLESTDGPGGASPLETMVSKIEGVVVTDDPAVTGDLYFRDYGSTDFDVLGLAGAKETNVLNLSADAMLAITEDIAGPTAIAVQAAGSVRGNIAKGKTGKLTLADLYRVFPLGRNPVDGSIGSPLCRFYIWKAEVKAAFEIAAWQGITNSDLFLSPAGARVEFDTSRPTWNPTLPLEATNGRVTKITLDTTHDDGIDNPTEVIFDLSQPDPWMGAALNLYPVVTSYIVASFAGTAGVGYKDMNGATLTLDQTILTRADTSDVKESEAFIAYIRELTLGNAGKLPDRYNSAAGVGAVPRRMVCTGPLCPL